MVSHTILYIIGAKPHRVKQVRKAIGSSIVREWVIVSVCMMEDLMMVKEVESEREKDSVLNENNMTRHRSSRKTAIYLCCWNACKRVNRDSLDSNIEGYDENQSRTLPNIPKLCYSL